MNVLRIGAAQSGGLPKSFDVVPTPKTGARISYMRLFLFVSLIMLVQITHAQWSEHAGQCARLVGDNEQAEFAANLSAFICHDRLGNERAKRFLTRTFELEPEHTNLQESYYKYGLK
jgi:hypothetical protein